MNNLIESGGQVYHETNPPDLGLLPQEQEKLKDFLKKNKLLTIKDGHGQSYGSLEYYWDPEENCWQIENITVKKGFKKKGLGKALLKAFCQEVGPNQPIHAVITHKKTVSALKEKCSNRMLLGEVISITGEDLKDIPFVKFLESGGIRVNRITFKKDRQCGKNYSYCIREQGITK
jgi:predicted GNAT family acetyltransferase